MMYGSEQMYKEAKSLRKMMIWMNYKKDLKIHSRGFHESLTVRGKFCFTNLFLSVSFFPFLVSLK